MAHKRTDTPPTSHLQGMGTKELSSFPQKHNKRRNRIVAKTHSGAIHLIGSKFIMNGLTEKEYGRLYSRLFELRQSGDYGDMYDATEEEIIPYISKTEALVSKMEELITLI